MNLYWGHIQVAKTGFKTRPLSLNLAIVCYARLAPMESELPTDFPHLCNPVGPQTYSKCNANTSSYPGKSQAFDALFSRSPCSQVCQYVTKKSRRGKATEYLERGLLKTQGKLSPRHSPESIHQSPSQTHTGDRGPEVSYPQQADLSCPWPSPPWRPDTGPPTSSSQAHHPAHTTWWSSHWL